MAVIKNSKGKQQSRSEKNVSASEVHQQRPQSDQQRRKRPMAVKAAQTAKGASGPRSDVPGVQKIKAALRQTKRLLAKDNLAADVRVKAERRLVSLEDELARAQIGRVERTMAVRYHKVKFFERQKAARKINQLKRELENGRSSEEKTLSKKELKALEKALFEARVDLNYILHYPKTSKYISLYPSQTQDRSPTTHETTDDPRNEDEEPEHQPTDETSKKRAEIRKSVRKATKAGSMSAEPELYLEEKSDRTPSDAIDTIMTGPNPTKTSEPKAQSKRKVSHPELTTTSKTKKSLESVHGSSSQRVTTGVTGDDFFDIDED